MRIKADPDPQHSSIGNLRIHFGLIKDFSVPSVPTKKVLKLTPYLQEHTWTPADIRLVFMHLLRQNCLFRTVLWIRIQFRLKFIVHKFLYFRFSLLFVIQNLPLDPQLLFANSILGLSGLCWKRFKLNSSEIGNSAFTVLIKANPQQI